MAESNKKSLTPADDWEAPFAPWDDPATEKIKTQLQALAHEGTKEALAKLNDFIAKEQNSDLRCHGMIARGECELFYYGANTEQEEQDWLLAKMAMLNEERIDDLEIKIAGAKFELKKMDLERKVHQALMKKVSAKEREEWKYNFSEDYYQMVVNRLVDLEGESRYYQSLAKTGRSLIKTKKYSAVPVRALREIKLDGENINFWEKEEDCGCRTDEEDPEIADIPF